MAEKPATEESESFLNDCRSMDAVRKDTAMLVARHAGEDGALAGLSALVLIEVATKLMSHLRGPEIAATLCKRHIDATLLICQPEKHDAN